MICLPPASGPAPILPNAQGLHSQNQQHRTEDPNRPVPFRDIQFLSLNAASVPLTGQSYRDPPGFALRVHEHFHLRGIHKIQKPRLRRLVISDGMSPRRLQPKGVPPTMASSSQSSPTPPAHICLCQPTPKIPRPRNAFILFRQHHHQAVMTQNPGKSNPAISKIIGEMWKTAAEETRREWQNHADEEKRQHMARYPEYRYQPRRSSKKGSTSSSSPNDSNEPSRCQRCGGRTGAYTLTEPSSYPILPAPHPSAFVDTSLPRSSSLRSLLGPSTSPFGRQPSPGDHKRKRSEDTEYRGGAEALLQLGSHERDFPSRSTAPTTKTKTTASKSTSTPISKSPTTTPSVAPAKSAAADASETSPDRPKKRRRIKDETIDRKIPPVKTSTGSPKVNILPPITATSPAMSYMSSTSADLPLERRVSDPYRAFQSRAEAVSPERLMPGHRTHERSLSLDRRIGTPTAVPSGAPPQLEKIQQIQQITRPLSNRSGGSSGAGRTILVAIEVSDTRLAETLSRGLHAELSDRFKSVGVQQPMDVPEWRQFLHRVGSPEDLVSDYLRALAACQRQLNNLATSALFDQQQQQHQQQQSLIPAPWDNRGGAGGAGGSSNLTGVGPQQFQQQHRLIPLSVSILQQYIFTHSATARRRLSPPTGNGSPVYTWEWCIDVWRGCPRPDFTIVVRNDDGSGVPLVESQELGLISIPAPVTAAASGVKAWDASVLRRLAFEIQELVSQR